LKEEITFCPLMLSNPVKFVNGMVVLKVIKFIAEIIRDQRIIEKDPPQGSSLNPSGDAVWLRQYVGEYMVSMPVTGYHLF
jgi:hypothetical protein